MIIAQKLDLRFRYFVHLLGVTVTMNLVVMARRTIGENGSLWRLGERFAWTPGLHLPEPIQLLSIWILPFSLALLLSFVGTHRVLLVALAISMWMYAAGTPGPISNHVLLQCATLSVCATLPFPVSGYNRQVVLSALRHLFVLTYLFAFLHKLNLGYFSVETGPVSGLLHVSVPELSKHRLLDTIVCRAAIVGSLFLEATLPLFLWIKPTRVPAALLGLIFHGLLSASGPATYSFFILSFYVLFFEESELNLLVERLRQTSLRVIGASIIVASAIFYRSYAWHEANNWALWGERVLYWILLVCWISTVIALFNTRHELTRMPVPATSLRQKFSRRAITVLFLLDGLYVVNCLAPYLGLKWNYSQDMFSSLNVHSTNHLFLPHIDLFGNDVYVHNTRISFAQSLSPEQMSQHASLEKTLKHQGGLHLNYLNYLLGNVCQQAVLRPIAVEYTLQNGGVKHFDDVCLTVPPSYPFNLYPWFED